MKSLNIDGQDYLMSQYADERRFILGGSPESLYGIFTILDYYTRISGLKIN